MYETGRGVPQDLTQAKYWYEKAAAQGNEKAKQNLMELNQRH
jgi:TPR repeat protein